MARSRNIKPGFFHNEYLVELPPETRLLFAGLPCIADREGRLDDRPKKIKMLLFPADVWDVDVMLDDLQASGFILRYEVDGGKYIQIINFLKHQHPHQDEKKSTIPEPCKHGASTMQQSDKHSSNPALTLNPSTLTLNPSKKPLPDSSESSVSDIRQSKFSEWWNTYDVKVSRKKAETAWKNLKWSKIGKEPGDLIADTKFRLEHDPKWPEFQPNPLTYLNGERWNDVIKTNGVANNQSSDADYYLRGAK